MLAPQNALNREDMETRRLAAASDLLNGSKQSLIARCEPYNCVALATIRRCHRSRKSAQTPRYRQAKPINSRPDRHYT
jgi:hypothetical protein